VLYLSRTPARIVIASRQSRLAMWQSEFVKSELQRLYPACEVSILGMTTQGDRILDVSLSKIGGKGLFVKELEAALADGRADIAVHSAKDVPMELPQGMTIAAFTERADPRDCLVSNACSDLGALPSGAVIGTSSLRREAQLRERHPTLRVAPLRGNLDTRLAKLDRGEYQAIILAASGLSRLGLAGRIRAMIDTADSVPAPGQGALAIECLSRRADLIDTLSLLNCPRTEACVRAERAVSRALSGNCQLPLGAYGEMEGAEDIRLHAIVAAVDGTRVVRAEARATADDPEALGERLARMLRERGAEEILASLER
jgi:hydroxymethylbilane synthase